MRIILVGGGRVGKSLAKLLVAENNDVTVIEKDQKTAEQLAVEIDALVLNADGTDADVLKRAGLDKADALITVTGDDRVNMVISKIAKDKNVPKVISRVTEPNLVDVFDEIDVTAINLTALTVNQIHKAVSAAKLSRGYVASICHDKAVILRFAISGKSPVLGKRISEVDIQGKIFWMERGGECFSPNDDTQLLEGDTIFLVTEIEEIASVTREIMGE